MTMFRAFVIVGVSWIVAASQAEDWPQWGGPQRDLVWRETGIVDVLPAVDPAIGMLPRVWTAKIGAGYAGPAVADGRVFVTDRLADDKLRRILDRLPDLLPARDLADPGAAGVVGDDDEVAGEERPVRPGEVEQHAVAPGDGHDANRADGGRARHSGDAMEGCR